MATTGDKNKLKFGVRNVHVVKATDTGTALTYEGKSIPWRGAVELTLDPNGDALEEYADDIQYAKIENNQGYTGKMTMEYLQPEIDELIFGNKPGEDGVTIENADNKTSIVALMFEFSGDQNHVRHVLYNVGFSRSSDGSATRSDKLEAQKAEFEFSAMPDPYNYNIKAKVPEGATPYATWFETVYVPSDEKPGEGGNEPEEKVKVVKAKQG